MIAFPIGAIYFFACIAIVIFVVLYLRRYSEFMSSGLFRIILLSCLALIVVALALLWYQNRPPKNKTRIAIFPVPADSTSIKIPWKNWAVAGEAIADVQQVGREDFLVYPLRWLWEAVNEDSLTSRNYILRYSKRIKADYLVLCKYDTRSPQGLLFWSLYDVPFGKKMYQDTLSFGNDGIQEIGFSLAHSVAPKLGIEERLKPGLVKVMTDSVFMWLALAEQAYLKRDFVASIDYTDKAFSADSSLTAIRNLLAEAYLDYGLELKTNGKPAANQLAIARRLCEHTIRQDSSCSDTYRILGEYYLTRKLWLRAEENFRQALAKNPDDARLYRDFAQLHSSRYHDLGFRNEKSLLEYAIFLNPCYEEARLELAKYYYFKQWPSRAEKVIHELLTINPTSLEGLLYLSKIYVSQNKIVELLKVGKRAVELAPENSDAYFNLGVAYYHWEDYDHAQAFFQRAVDLDDHINAHLYLAYLYNKKGNTEAAIKHLRRRLHLRRDDLYANMARDLLYQLTHQDSLKTNDHDTLALPKNSDDGGDEIGVSATQF